MNTTDYSAVIASITCPITQEVMTDPVQGNDGQTYERSAIVNWLNRNNTSPLTKQPMFVSDLKVNAAIRFLVDKYHSGQFGGGNVGSSDLSSGNIDIGMVKLKSSMKFDDHDDNLMISFDIDTNTIPESMTSQTFPQDIVCIVDRSGSMMTNVEAKDENGNRIEDGLSQLDLVKYAVRTVAYTLKPSDRLAIVSFDHMVQLEIALTNMTEVNYTALCDVINNIEPRGSTNIWQAIEMALAHLNERTDKSRNSHIIVLTDGVPNTGRPSRGEIATLTKHRRNLNFSTSINTMGFGYDLEDGLLYGLSKAANGVTAHIPDGSMIASVFNHLISTIICTVAMNLQLEVKLTGSIRFSEQPLYGDYNYELDDGVLKVDIGTVQQQQSRNIILNLLIGDGAGSTNKNTYVKENVHYSYSYKVGDVVTSVGSNNLVNTVLSASCYTSQLACGVVVNKICEAIHAKTLELTGRTYRRLSANGSGPIWSKDIYNELVEYFERDNCAGSRVCQGLYDTIMDQVREGLSINENHVTVYRNKQMSYFKKWGLSYLSQLCSHINNEKRANYKDAACSNFGGELFNSVVEYASDKFDTLDPPVPSNAQWSSDTILRGVDGSSMPAAPRRVNTSAYNSQDAGSGICFAGNCRIMLDDGSDVLVKDLRAGDKVLTMVTPDNSNLTMPGRVVCILKTIIPDNIQIPMVNIGGLLITGNHPVFVNNKWQFPAQVSSVHNVQCSELYSLVLDVGHIAFIQDVPCICLGHNFETEIIKHNYLGSDAVINDLMKMPGWDNGLIVNRIDSHMNVDDTVVRDNNGHICQIKYLESGR
jgi:uncharacterized protein YegL